MEFVTTLVCVLYRLLDSVKFHVSFEENDAVFLKHDFDDSFSTY